MKLTEAHRAAIRVLHSQDMTLGEIAKIIGCSPSAVSATLSKGLYQPVGMEKGVPSGINRVFELHAKAKRLAA